MIALSVVKSIVISKAKMIAVLRFNQEDDGDHTTKSVIALVIINLLFFGVIGCTRIIPCMSQIVIDIGVTF
jgi:hypothetical protein